MKKFRKIRHNLRLNKIDVLDFCSLLILSLQMDFAKECLKTYDALIHYIGKNRNFVIQAINSENDQKIGRKYNGNFADNFLRKTPL